MKKGTLITFLISGLILIGLVVFFTRPAQDSQKPGETPITLPSGTDIDTGDSQPLRLIIQTTEGTLDVPNFLNNPQTTPDPVNEGHYFLGYFIDPTVNEPADVPYAIEYIESTNYFGIVLLQEPLSESRIEAEQFLMGQLGIIEEEMCSLKYMMSVPNRVNKFLAGRSLGFSFCPNSFPLE